MDPSTIAVKEADGQLVVECPYSPAFAAAARVMGGHRRTHLETGRDTWVFDRYEANLARQALRDIYGTDGDSPCETVTVRVTVSSTAATYPRLWLGGWLIAHRDPGSPVQLAPGVRVIDGPGFPPAIDDFRPPLGGAGTVLEITEFPKPLAERLGLEPGVSIPWRTPALPLAISAVSEAALLLWEVSHVLDRLPDSSLHELAARSLNHALRNVSDLDNLIRAL